MHANALRTTSSCAVFHTRPAAPTSVYSATSISIVLSAPSHRQDRPQVLATSHDLQSLHRTIIRLLGNGLPLASRDALASKRHLPRGHHVDHTCLSYSEFFTRQIRQPRTALCRLTPPEPQNPDRQVIAPECGEANSVTVARRCACVAREVHDLLFHESQQLQWLEVSPLPRRRMLTHMSRRVRSGVYRPEDLQPHEIVWHVSGKAEKAASDICCRQWT